MKKRGRKRHRGKVTPEVIEEMKSLREKGMSCQKIANRLGLNIMTVYNHLKKAPKGRKKVTPEILERMKSLREKGTSYNKIADKLGLSVMTVYNRLKKEEKVGLIERLKRALGRK